MNANIFRALAGFVGLATATHACVANAGIQLIGTRVVYPAGESEVTVRLANNATSPRLIQAWIDSGKPGETIETSSAPFMVIPAIARVEPGEGQVLRILSAGGTPPPDDREAVYWLNVVDVPPRPDASENGNYLQFAVRTRIKVFHRPKSLEGQPAAAVSGLAWSLAPRGDNWSLTCTNPGPYNVSFADVRLKGAPDRAGAAVGGGMCPARGRETFELHGGVDSGVLSYKMINDFGAFVDGEALYSR